MAEPVEAKVPGKHSYQVVSLLQIRSYLYLVIVSGIRLWSSLESSLKDHQPFIYVEPVLGVCGYAGFHR